MPSMRGNDGATPGSTDNESQVSRAFLGVGPRYRAVQGLLLLALLISTYVLIRLAMERSSPSPPVGMESDGALKTHHSDVDRRLGLEGKLQVLLVNGRSVDSPDAFRRAIRETSRPWLSLQLAAEGRDSPATVVISRLDRYPELEAWITEDGTLREGIAAAWPDQPFAAGDRLLRLAGVEVQGPASLRTALQKHATSGFREMMTLDVIPGPASSLNAAASEQYRLLLWQENWDLAVTLYLAGLAFIFIAFVVFYLKPHTWSSWGFMGFGIIFGAFEMFRAIPPHLRSVPEYWMFTLLQCLLPAAGLMLVVTFTPLRSLLNRSRIIGFGLLLSALLFLLNQVFYPGLPYLELPFFLAWSFGLLLILAVSAPTDWWLRAWGYPLRALDRTRGNVMRLAMLAAFFPIGLVTFMREIWDLGGAAQFIAELAVLLFPLAIGYAVVRHNLLQINEMVLQGLVFLSLGGLVAMGFSLMVALSQPLFETVPLLDSPLVKGVSVGAMVFGAAPLQSRMRRAIDKRYQSADEDFEALSIVLQKDTDTILYSQDFCTRFAADLARTIPTNTVSILVRNGETGNWWLAAHTADRLHGPTVDRLRPLFNLMEHQPRHLTRETLLDDLDFASRPPDLLQAFDALDAVNVFPLIAHGEFWGILAIGDKTSMQNSTRGEMKVLHQHALDCALGLYASVQGLRSRRRPVLPGGRIIDLYPDFPPMIGPYRVDGVLGKGGMAFVYRGRRNGQIFAVKLANHLAQVDPVLLQRFYREGEALLRLQHPFVIRLVESGEVNGEPYLVMEYQPGGSLLDHLKRNGPMDEPLARRFIRECASGLAAALKEGILHRDVKPANIILTESLHPRITDFGLAKMDHLTTITTHTDIKGTPAYLSPEVMLGQEHDWRSDQYALGLVFFESLTGRRPFQNEAGTTVQQKALSHEAPDVREFRPEISPATAAVVRRMLERSPADRFGSYEDLIAVLAHPLPAGDDTVTLTRLGEPSAVHP